MPAGNLGQIQPISREGLFWKAKIYYVDGRKEAVPSMPLTEQIITESVNRYWREYDRYVKLADFVADACREMIEAKLILRDRFKSSERSRAISREASQIPAR